MLDPLQGEAEDSSSTKVQLPREAASEDNVGEIVALVMGCFNDGVQLLDLGGYYRVVGAEVSSEPAQDVDGLLALTIGNEPSAAVAVSVTLIVLGSKCVGHAIYIEADRRMGRGGKDKPGRFR